MSDIIPSTARSLPEAPAVRRPAELPGGTVAEILPTVCFTFVCYFTIGILLAILPIYVHLRLGYGTVLAGLVISTQYVATVLSRPRVGRMVDVAGPKRIVVLGLFICAASGLFTFAAAFFHFPASLSLALLLLGRLLLGVARVPAAAFAAAALIGIGYSLVFPSLAVEAVRHIPNENRGTALGAYNAFIDLSLFLTGPVAGAIISHSGYRALFLISSAGVFLAFCLTIGLASRLAPRPSPPPEAATLVG